MALNQTEVLAPRSGSGRLTQANRIEREGAGEWWSRPAASESARMRPRTRRPIAANDDCHCVRWVTTISRMLCCAPRIGLRAIERSWSQLTAPDLIGRTRDTLTAMHARNSGAMRRKKAALSAFHAECLKTYGGHEAWVQAKADYEQWRVGASNFERMVSGALAEVNDIWELRAQQRGSSGVLQAQLACALNAIRNHRDACDTADIQPEPHDLALWRTLEHVADTDDALTSEGPGGAD